MANMITELFDRYYEEFLNKAKTFVENVLGGGYDYSIDELDSYIIDLYIKTFLMQAEELLVTLGIEFSEIEKRRIINSVDGSAFAIANHRRVKEILTNKVSYLQGLKDTYTVDGVFDRNAWTEHAMSNITGFIDAELQMTLEKSSVSSAKLIEDVFEVPIYKQWNSVLDKKTCMTCASMHGTRIRVTDSFMNHVPSGVSTSEVQDLLSYTGGDLAYAHPHCRCWFTYSTG